MGEAMALGWAASGLPDVFVLEPRRQRQAQLLEKGLCLAGPEDIADARAVIIAVKPQDLEAVCRDISPRLGKDTLVVSIAAGVTRARACEWLGRSAAARVMPNLAVRARKGAIAIFAPGQENETQALFAPLGRTWVFDDEDRLDPFTAVVGSGPAYIGFWVEALADGARALGFSPEESLDMACAVLSGTAALVEEGEIPSLLMRKVASPGGTTEAALYRLKEKGAQEALREALLAAAFRAGELGGKKG